MAHFSKEYIDFFKELALNNKKEWFDENRKRYEKFVKKPFAAFTDEMIGRINADDPEVRIEAKDAVFRINRDIRFSKDKTPYKTQMSAIVSPGGKKDKSRPGMYFEIRADEVRIYGGTYMMDKKQLYSLRQHIVDNMETFSSLLADKAFQEKFGGQIHGERNKILPPEFKEAAAKQPLIANKSFYYYTILSTDHLLSDQLPDVLMDYYYASKPLKLFLTEGMNF